ncbi:hypothetical protein ACWDUL_28720 [Nocardia niigatensis]
MEPSDQAAVRASSRPPGRTATWQHDGLTRAERSRALRDAVRDGWDAVAVRLALPIGRQPALFDPDEAL